MKNILILLIFSSPTICQGQSYFSKVFNILENEFDSAKEVILKDSLYFVRDRGASLCSGSNSSCTQINKFNKDGVHLGGKIFNVPTDGQRGALMLVIQDSLLIFSKGNTSTDTIELIITNTDLDSLDSKFYDFSFFENQTGLNLGVVYQSEEAIYGSGSLIFSGETPEQVGMLVKFNKQDLTIDTLITFHREGFNNTLAGQFQIDEEGNLYSFYAIVSFPNGVYQTGFYKFDSDLNFIYRQDIPTPTISLPNGIILCLPNGNIVLSHRSDNGDAALHCMNDVGDQIWRLEEYQQGDYHHIYNHGEMILSQDGNILLCSEYYYDDPFYPGEEVFRAGRLRKLTYEGEVLWDRFYGVQDENGEYYTAPYFNGLIEEPSGDILIYGRNKAEDNSFSHWLVRTDAYGCVEEGCQVSSIDLLAQQNKTYFKIKQNPVENQILLEIKDNLADKNLVFKVFSLEGKLVASNEVNNLQDNISIPFQGISSGIYFITLYSSKGFLQSEKLIKL